MSHNNNNNDDNNIITNIRLTYRDPQTNQRHVQCISSLSALTPLDDLYQMCLEMFVLSTTATTTKQRQQKDLKTKVELLVGFPPKPLEEVISTNRTTTTTTIGDCGITSQMNIMVRLVQLPNKEEEEDEGKKEKEGNTTKATSATATSSATTTTSGRPSRRAAAIAANETFREVEKAIQSQQQQEERAKKKNPKKIQPSTTTKRTTTNKPSSVQISGDGRTLSTGQIVRNNNTTTTTKSNKKSSKSSIVFQSEEDVTNALLSSVISSTNTNSSSKMLNAILRKGMKNAVAKSYEASKANIRLNAYQQKLYTINTSSSSSSSTSTTNFSLLQPYHVGTFDITYSKGLEGRGTYTDTIEILTKETLEAVIRAVYNTSVTPPAAAEEDEDIEEPQEISMLKPIYMSQVSPRVFWSLAYHFPQHTSIEESLQVLCDDVDWSFIFNNPQQQGFNKRTRFLSEKAKENLRQEKQKQQKLCNNTTVKIDKDDKAAAAAAAIEVITKVEQAMEETLLNNNNNTHLERRRLLLANAALNRIHSGNYKGSHTEAITEEWHLLTPSEEDEDELLECIQEGTKEQYSISQKQWLARYLIHTCNIHNWRELANSNSNELYGKFLNNNDSNGFVTVTEDDVDHWIDFAQIKSIDEVMLDILDGNEDIFILLRDFIKSGTPKDLVVWACIPDMLLQEIRAVPEGLPLSVAIDSSVIKRWCHRAQKALDSYEWLNLYITPID